MLFSDKMKAHRISIDEIDSELVSLFQKRMKISEKIGLLKKESDVPIRNIEREEEVIQKAVDSAVTELKAYTETLLRTIIQLSCEYQENILSSK